MGWLELLKGKKKTIYCLRSRGGRGLWIWTCYFGKAYSINDVDILNSSPIITGILKGDLLREFEYTVDENVRKEI